MTHFVYFAYGSNMSSRRLLRRTPSAVRTGTGRLVGYTLGFNKYSLKDGSGKCTIARADSADVYGVLYRIAMEELDTLDACEGIGRGYDRIMVDISDENGMRVQAQTYVGVRLDSNVLPFSWYLEHVLAGARESGLPDWYVRTIENIAVIDDPDTRRETMELAIYR